MICYASQTSTKRNLRLMRLAGWRLLLSPAGHLNPHDFAFALDNGAWAAFKAGRAFDVPAFEDAVARFGGRADFIVLPDIVAGGMASLEFSISWLPRLAGHRQLLIAVQDGMAPSDIVPHLSSGVGIFLGGSTEWKLATMAQWGAVAAECGVHYHVARVNSVKRIMVAAAAGACSIDGSSATRYALTLPPLDAAARMGDLFSPRRGETT